MNADLSAYQSSQPSPVVVKRVEQEGKQAAGGKAYYVEESVKILQHVIVQADPILTELVSKVKQFERWYLRQRASQNLNPASDRRDPEYNGSAGIIIAFQSMKEIEAL